MQGFGQSSTSWWLSQVTESRTLSGWLNWVHKSLLYWCVDVWACARRSPPACFSLTFLYNAWLLWTDKFSISPAAIGRFHLFVLRYYPGCCYSDCQWEHCAGEAVNSELAGGRWCMSMCASVWSHSFFSDSTPFLLPEHQFPHMPCFCHLKLDVCLQHLEQIVALQLAR